MSILFWEEGELFINNMTEVSIIMVGFPCTDKILKVSTKLNFSTSSDIKMVSISARIEEEKMMERGIGGQWAMLG